MLAQDRRLLPHNRHGRGTPALSPADHIAEAVHPAAKAIDIAERCDESFAGEFTSAVSRNRQQRSRGLRHGDIPAKIAAESRRLRSRGVVQLCTTVDAWCPAAQRHDLGRRCLEALLEAGPERELYQEFRRIAGQPIENAISRLRPKIDLFFDKVLVNAPDPAVRQNRLTLLQTLLAEFSTIADFSEIVTNS